MRDLCVEFQRHRRLPRPVRLSYAKKVVQGQVVDAVCRMAEEMEGVDVVELVETAERGPLIRLVRYGRVNGRWRVLAGTALAYAPQAFQGLMRRGAREKRWLRALMVHALPR